MRWLLIVFLISLAALLFAAAGAARHIWMQRAKPRSDLPVPLEPREESDLETKS